MSDAITLDVLSSSPVQLDVGDADPIAREEIAALATRVTTAEGDISALDGRMDTAEGDISALDGRMDTAEGDISTLGTTVDGIDARVEAIEDDYVTAEDVMGALGGEAPTLVAGSSRAMLGDAETASWMGRTTAADGAALIEAIYGNTVVQDGSLLPVRMEGVETVGFNLAKSTYVNSDSGSFARTLFAEIDWMKPSTQYAITFKGAAGNKVYLSENLFTAGTNLTCTGDLQTVLATTVGEVSKDSASQYVTGRGWSILKNQGSNTVVPSFTEVCINLSDPARNGTYEPYWSSQRTIPTSTYFPNGMRSAGSVADELRADAAVTRVGAVDLGTLTWDYVTSGGTFFKAALDDAAFAKSSSVIPNDTCALYTTDTPDRVYSGAADKTIAQNVNKNLMVHDTAYTDAATFKAAMNGVMLHYALATPATTLIDPPLPMSYRTGAGGTERVMVASGTMSAPPIFVTRYPLDPADLAASLAPRESATAEANHAGGDLIMLGWTLCKVTTAIARGEAITIGTNVTRTSVAAEIAALS